MLEVLILKVDCVLVREKLPHRTNKPEHFQVEPQIRVFGKIKSHLDNSEYESCTVFINHYYPYFYALVPSELEQTLQNVILF